MLLQSHSSMSSPSLASPWFINDKACHCALLLYCCSRCKKYSDTPAMLVMIAWSLWKTLGCVNLYISNSFKSPLFRYHCSSPMSHIFSVSMPSPFRLFRCFAIPSEPVLLPPISKIFLCMYSTWAIDSTINHSSCTCQDSNLLSNSPWHNSLHTPEMAK